MIFLCIIFKTLLLNYLAINFLIFRYTMIRNIVYQYQRAMFNFIVCENGKTRGCRFALAGRLQRGKD